jgi:pantetheine-phosphate adenylyltransferase
MSDKSVAIFPGSFNPWHKGHGEVLEKALRVFDKIIVAVGINPEKNSMQHISIAATLKEQDLAFGIKSGCIEVVTFTGLLADYVREQNKTKRNINAVIRGLRNINDFEFEKTQQTWNASLNIGIPTFYVIASPGLQHVSSSAIRMIENLENK